MIGTALILGWVGSSGLSLFSAEETAKPTHPRGSVAVLDINRIYKESKYFKDEMEKIHAEVAKATEKVKKGTGERQSPNVKKWKNFPPVRKTALRRKIIREDQAALTASVNIQKGKFVRQEAAIYLKTYQKINTEVDAYAKENGIDVVLRLQDDLDANKPESILSHINRNVVWNFLGCRHHVDYCRAAGQEQRLRQRGRRAGKRG